MQLDNDVSRLKIVKSNYLSQIYRMQDDIAVGLPRRMNELESLITRMEQDVVTASSIPLPMGEDGKPLTDITVFGNHFTNWKKAGTALYGACVGLKEISTGGEIGSFGGFKLSASFDCFNSTFEVNIIGAASRKAKIGKDAVTNIRHIHEAVSAIPQSLAGLREQLSSTQQQLENAKLEVLKPFPKEQELNDKLARLSELNRQLNVDHSQKPTRNSDITLDADAPRRPSIRARLKNGSCQAQHQRSQPNLNNQRKKQQTL